jgi:acylphosphatase
VIGSTEVKAQALLVRIEGHVQGVGFRAWTLSEARSLGLAGWVRNEADGTVTARIEGAQERVDRMLERLQFGPPGASVTKLSSEPAAPEATESGFRITR